MIKKPSRAEIAEAVLEGKITNKDTLATFLQNYEIQQKIDAEAPSVKNVIDQVLKNVKGVQGDKGDKGDKGDDGKDGEHGEQGKQGVQGKQGIQGKQGEKGDKGDDGDTPDTDKITADAQNAVLKRVLPTIPTLSQVAENVLLESQKLARSLETLTGEKRLSANAIKGLEKIQKDNLDRAISILDQRTQFLINKPSVDLSSYIIGDGITKITVGTTQPSSPSIGDLWIDSS